MTDIIELFKTFIKRNLYALTVSIVVSAILVSIVLYYTHGNLIYGVDSIGYYSVFGTILNGSYSSLIYAFSLFIARDNYYVGLYLGLFFSSVLTTMAVYTLANELFKNYLDTKTLQKVCTLSIVFYVFNPYILVLGNQSSVGATALLTITYVGLGGFFIFLAEVIKFYKSNLNKSEFNKWDILLMSIGLGISLPSLPNYARIFIVGIFIFLYFVIIKIIFGRIKNIKSFIIKSLEIFITLCVIAFIVGLYVLAPSLLHLETTINTLQQATNGFSSLGFYLGSFNSLINVFRLLDLWSFNAYNIFYNAYLSTPLLVITSILWSILAICIPLILDKKNNRILIPIIVLILLSIFWAKYSNPPLGFLNNLIVSHIPLGIQLIPPSLLTTLILTVFYSILSAYSIIYISFIYLNQKKYIRINSISILLTILLVSLLLISVLPIFNGQLEGRFYNQQLKGYKIPVDYQIVKNYLIKNDTNVILFPSVNRYINTSWGYKGASYFYNQFFYPVNISTPFELGTYSEFSTAYASLYANFSNPVMPGKANKINLSYGYPTTYKAAYYTINSTMVSLYGTNNSTFNQVTFPLSNTPGIANQINITYRNAIPYKATHYTINSTMVSLYGTNNSTFNQVTFHLNNTFNLGNLSYVKFSFYVKNQTSFMELINQGKFFIGFVNNSQTVWYNIGNTCKDCYIEPAGLNEINLTIIKSDPYSSFQSYKTSTNFKVTSFIFKFYQDNTQKNVSLTYPRLYFITRNKLNNTININNLTYLRFNFEVKNQTSFINLVNSNRLLVGFVTNNTTIWYDTGDPCWGCYIEPVGSDGINLTIIKDNPYIPSAANYNGYQSGVNSFIFKFYNNKSVENISMGYPKVYGVTNMILNQTWISLIEHYKIGYILTDNSSSNDSEVYQSRIYDDKVINYLLESKDITLIYKGNYLDLYKLNNELNTT